MRPRTPGVSPARHGRFRRAGVGGFDGGAVDGEGGAFSGQGEALRVSVHERRAVAGGHV